REEFAECFGKETSAGLYDRFIYGFAPKGFEYTSWTGVPERRPPTRIEIISREADKLWCAWKQHYKHHAQDDETRELGRLEEMALRIAVITAAANQESTVTEPCMRAALEFCDWQFAIRQAYKPS